MPPARSAAPPQAARPAARPAPLPATAPAIRLGAPVAQVAGKQYYKTRDGKMIELPPDITPEQAAKLESDARAALTKIGKGPGPKPVPDVKKLDKKEDKKTQLKAFEKGKKPGAGSKGRSKPRAGGSPSLSNVGSGKVAQYLAAKAAPVVGRGFNRLQQLRQGQQTHDDAGQKRAQAESAVVIPASEGQSKSNSAQVTVVGDRPAPKVDANKGKQALQEKLKENVPKTIEDVDNFKRDKKAEHTGAEVLKTMQTDKNAVVSTFQDMSHTPAPAPREHEPEALPPPEGAPATGGLDLGKDGIAPLQKEHTDLSKYTNEADQKLKDEGVTQEQLDMVDGGDLAVANKEKKGMETAAKTEPIAVQKFATDQGKNVEKDLKQEESKQRADLNAKRKTGLGATRSKQQGAKSALEKKREEVAAKINGMYTATQDKVKKRLADLETQSMKRFDEGNAKASKEFEDTVNREIDAFKDKRYSGWFGWAKKAKDWLLGMDDLPEVKAIFDRNREKFVATVNKLVEDISADNKRVVQECKDELQKTRTQIKEYVDKLGPALKDIGKQAADEMNSKLDQLDSFVAKKEEELQDKLKDKQTAAIKAIDEKIEKMKDAMSGALSKLGKLLLAAAKKFFTWALEKFGYSLSDIEAIINRGAAVLKAIFTQPLQFVKNLMNAAITGFKNFGKNFLKHLKDALFEWLTGSIEGLVLPQTWDFPGIISVALQMIGISYQNIRRHMVDVMGEPVVAGLEKTFELVKTLITKGPMAAWEQLKEMAAEMRDAFIDAVKSFIQQKIIEQAIQWLVSLFIPGAGIVKAIIGIYDTVVFFIKKAKQIIDMISNFLSSIGEIAAGNIGAAADAMEKGLARGLSLVINFLAALLRLSGITNKIRDAIQKIRAKVDAVLAKVAKWIADKAKAIISKVVGAVKGAVGKVVSWWKIKKPFTGADGKPHNIYVDRDAGKKPIVIVRSAEQTLPDLIALQPQPQRDKLQAKYKQIEALFGGAEPDEKEQQDRHDRVQRVIDEIAVELGGGSVRPTAVTYGLSGSRAMRVIADPLTRQPGNTKGSPASGIQFKELIEAIVEPREQTITRDDKEIKRLAFTMFSSAHLLADRLNGPAIGWNLANTGKGLNSEMKAPEKIAEDLKNKGAELKYVTTADYYNDPPPNDRNTIAAGNPDQKLKWLGGLVAKSYKVAISLIKPAPGDATKPGALGAPVECADPPGFLNTLKLVGGPPPPTTADRILEIAKQTAETTPTGMRVRGIVFLAREARIDTNASSRALEQLAKAGSLEFRGGRYYLKS